MALKGNLKDFTSTQLLNLVSLARKTGLLIITRETEKISLYFKDGRLIYARMSGAQNDLLAILVKAGKLTTQQASVIRDEGGSGDDKALGIRLIGTGLVSREDVVKSCKAQMLSTINTLFNWKDGQFNYEPDILPPKNAITIPINLENIILEGSRRIDEHNRLLEEVPDLSMVMQFSSQTDAKLRDINLSVDEWRVISFISPQYTIKRIAQANNLDDFQIRRIVYGFIEAGLVELRPADGVPERISRALFNKGKTPVVERNVIERIILRIKRI
jgi:hypothetical protein